MDKITLFVTLFTSMPLALAGDIDPSSCEAWLIFDKSNELLAESDYNVVISPGYILQKERKYRAPLITYEYIEAYETMILTRGSTADTASRLAIRLGERLRGRETIEKTAYDLGANLHMWLDEFPALKILLIEIYLSNANKMDEDERFKHAMLTQRMLEDKPSAVFKSIENKTFDKQFERLDKNSFNTLQDHDQYLYLFLQLCDMGGTLTGRDGPTFIRYIRMAWERINKQPFPTFAAYLDHMLSPERDTTGITNVYEVRTNRDLREIIFRGWGVPQDPGPWDTQLLR